MVVRFYIIFSEMRSEVKSLRYSIQLILACMSLQMRLSVHYRQTVEENDKEFAHIKNELQQEKYI